MECNDVSCQFCTSEDVKYSDLLCNLSDCSKKHTEQCPLFYDRFPEEYPDSCIITDYVCRNYCTASRCKYED